MKLAIDEEIEAFKDPAAFRRLCVETQIEKSKKKINKPAAFRRLCVETR